MPILVHCEELQTGMRLSDPFLFRGRMMLPGGHIMARDDIEILKKKYPEVTLRIGDPVLDEIANFEDDGHEREIAATAQQMVSHALSNVQERFADRTALLTVNFATMRQTTAAVLEYLRNNPVTAAIIDQSGDRNDYLAIHSGNVFYLALVLGSAVRDYVVRERLRQTQALNLSASICMDLMPLGLGAMFMDVGMFPLQHIFEEAYVLTDLDRKMIREHPNVGADQLPDNLPAGVKMVVRTHHENHDGSGYPAAIPGPDQHIFTRIIRLCDAYEAATAKRIYAQAKSPARALWEISLGPARKYYDSVLAKVFRSLIQPFPIGAKLKLSDGRTGILVRYNRKEPFRPQVIVAFDATGRRLEKAELQPPFYVGEGNTLRLAHFNGEDLAYLYTTPVIWKTDDEPAPHEIENLLEACFP